MPIEFHFKNENKKYFSGQLVEGHVKIRSSRIKLVNKICLYFKGVTNVKFVKNGKTYRDQILHFNKKLFIVGTQYGKAKAMLEVGGTSLPFNFKLPDDLPASIRTSCGYTKYTIKCKVFTK